MKESNIFNKILLFAIIICSLRNPKDELYNVNDVSINPQRNAINLGNGRILAQESKPFRLDYFYESTLTLADHKEDDDNSNDIASSHETPDSHINDSKNNKVLDLKSKISKLNNLANFDMKNVSAIMKKGDDKVDPQLIIKNLSNNDVLVILEESMKNKNDENDGNGENGEYMVLNEYLESFKVIIEDSFLTDLDYDQIEEEYNKIFTNFVYNKSLRKHINKNLLKSLSKLVLWNASVTFLAFYVNLVFMAFYSLSAVDFRIQYKQIKKLRKLKKILKKYAN
ncbi:fam-b protein [Plasmodium chabaudi adami]|uniref:Fam-b protein n=1 Tax=Plasmodium chabaudi adami TaxID=5826 RepID=A0A1D3L7B2_PLACE|nr:fam-b protein [Plasmodium chabaudi adami]